VDRRVPKSLLVENGAPTASDKRHINDGIEEFRWMATLKPTTIALPIYRDAEREYLEINVLSLTLRAGAKTVRLEELVHRAVPYPVFLITHGAGQGISVVHKRWSQSESGKTVLDGDIISSPWPMESDKPFEAAFMNAIALGRQPGISLFSVYQGWMDTLLALEAARRTGKFIMLASPEQARARSDALLECDRLDSEIARLRSSASKEKQLPRQVELNLELKRVEARLLEAGKDL